MKDALIVVAILATIITIAGITCRGGDYRDVVCDRRPGRAPISSCGDPVETRLLIDEWLRGRREADLVSPCVFIFRQRERCLSGRDILGCMAEIENEARA